MLNMEVVQYPCYDEVDQRIYCFWTVVEPWRRWENNDTIAT
jgi:hypothetical protein